MRRNTASTSRMSSGGRIPAWRGRHPPCLLVCTGALGLSRAALPLVLTLDWNGVSVLPHQAMAQETSDRARKKRRKIDPPFDQGDWRSEGAQGAASPRRARSFSGVSLICDKRRAGRRAEAGGRRARWRLSACARLMTAHSRAKHALEADRETRSRADGAGARMPGHADRQSIGAGR